MNVTYGYNLNDIDKINKKNNKEKKFTFIDHKTLKNFEVLIYNDKEDKVLNFGKLRGLI